MKISYDTIIIIFTLAAFLVNVTVQMTKAYIPVPTKLWCIVVSFLVNIGILWAGSDAGILKWSIGNILVFIFSSFLLSFVSMYGFDTFKELWQRFKDGENINGNN